jgi:hypothetical protein
MARFSGRPTWWAVTLFALVLSLAASSTAQADSVLSDNLAATTGGVEPATGDAWLTAGFGTDGSSYTLTSVTLLMQRLSIGGQAQLEIYSDDLLQPGDLVGSLTAAGPVSSTLSETTFTTDGIALAANSSYWVVLKAITGQFAWAWASDSSGVGAGFQHTWGSSDDAGSVWFTFDSYPLQMRVETASANAAVPEPSALVSFAVGAGLVLLAFSRRSAAQTHIN